VLPLLEKILATKKPQTGLPQSLLDAYEAIGKADGFQIEKVEKGLIFIGKTVKVALRVEFGNSWEFFNVITALRETPADIKVIVTSSNVKSIKMEAVYTVLKKKLEEKGRWVIIDIEGKKPPMKLNFAPLDQEGQRPSRQRHSESRRPASSEAHAAPRAPSPAEQPLQEEPSPNEPEQPKKPLSFWEGIPFFGRKSSSGEPVKMKKSKNYGMQPADAKPRRKMIYGKRKKQQD
jgi:hypothetical protein